MGVRLRGAGSSPVWHLCPVPIPLKHPQQEFLWISVGFVPRGTRVLCKTPLSSLFINIRAKFSLFKLLVAVQILIVGFKFRIRRVGWWGHEWEFSIFGSGVARCLAKTWFEGERGEKKESIIAQ